MFTFLSSAVDTYLKKKNYLFEKERGKENSHALVHSLNSCNDQSWARLKLRARN